MRRLIINITLIMAALVITWMFNRYAVWFFTALGFMLIAIAGMIIYLLVCWRRLTFSDRYEGIFALVGWSILLYATVHANGLTISSLVVS